MSIEQDLREALWDADKWYGVENMSLCYLHKGEISFDVFFADDYAGGREEGRIICRRLAAAMNYCRGKTVEELEGKS